MARLPPPPTPVRTQFHRHRWGDRPEPTRPPHIQAANLFGAERSLVLESAFTSRRDIDILFVGSLHPAENLEERLEYYLEHEEQRRRLVESAQSRVADHRFENLWDQLVVQIEANLPTLQEWVRSRPPLDSFHNLCARIWEHLGSGGVLDPTLISELEQAARGDMHPAFAENALGLLATRTPVGQAPKQAALEKARHHFQCALELEPSHVLAGLNLAEVLAALQQNPAAIKQARQALAVLDSSSDLAPNVLDSGHFPAELDFFRVEWERAAWIHAGQTAEEMQAKRTLLHWRLHAMLAKWTGDLLHYRAAAPARFAHFPGNARSCLDSAWTAG